MLSGRFRAVLIAILVSVGPVTGAVLAEDAPRDGEPARWIVGFRDGVPDDVAAGSAFAGATVLRTDTRGGFAVVSAADADAFRERATADERVDYLERDALLDLLFTPNDPMYTTHQYGPQQMDAPTAWDATLGSTDVTVCVIDSGIRHSHQDFSDGRYAGGYDYVNDDSNPWDDNGHGTFVTGIAVADTHDGVGIAGVAQSTYYHVKSMRSDGRGYPSDVASGINWCTSHGANITSMSLGAASNSTTIYNAVRSSWDDGVLLIAATGNDACTNCVRYPAAHGQVVAVGCVTSTKNLCSFSNQGPEVELVAAGHNVVSTYHTGDNRYAQGSGTSASAPHVAGAAALVWATHPDKTNGDIRALLQEHAEDLGSSGRDSAYGFGLVKPADAISGDNVAPEVESATCTPEPSRKREQASCAFVVTDDSTAVALDVDWGDGTTTRWPASGWTAPGSFTLTHTWTQAGTFTVTANATDNHPITPRTGNDSLLDHVVNPNVAPEVESIACTPEPGVKRRPASCTFSVVDDGPGVTLRVAWGDGTTTVWPASGDGAPGNVTLTHNWTTHGTFTLTANATDDDPDLPLTGNDSTLAHVVDPNAAPVLDPLECAGVGETRDHTVACRVRAADDGYGVAYTLDWGDGATTRIPATGLVAPGEERSAEHPYAADGNYTISVTVVDDDPDAPLTEGPETTRVVVAPHANPQPEFACGPDPITAGDRATCTFTATDDSAGISFTVDWGDGRVERLPSRGTITPGESLTASHRWAGEGAVTVNVTATDSGVPPLTGSVESAVTVTRNQAPFVRSVECAPEPVRPGEAVTCTFRATDDSIGIHYEVDWGDGNVTRVPATGTVTPGTTASATHAWDAPDDWPVKVTARDSNVPSASGVRSTRHMVEVCEADFTGYAYAGAAGLTVDGVTSRWVSGFSTYCGGVTFLLEDDPRGGAGDFDVCWYADARLLACHTENGDERGVVPDDATRARVTLFTGANSIFRLRMPAPDEDRDPPEEPDPLDVDADPPTTVSGLIDVVTPRPPYTRVLRHDDGSREGSVFMNYRDDSAYAWFDVPPFVVKDYSTARVHVYGAAFDCGVDDGTRTHALVVNQLELVRFSPCAEFPHGTFAWRNFTVRVETLVTEDLTRIGIDKPSGHWSASNLALGIDRDSDSGQSTVRQDSEVVRAEPMFHLELTRP